MKQTEFDLADKRKVISRYRTRPRQLAKFQRGEMARSDAQVAWELKHNLKGVLSRVLG